jgi:polar amino acid transport system permease protein
MERNQQTFIQKARRIVPYPLLWDMSKFIALIGFLTWLLARGTERLGYNWQWYRVPRYLFFYENGNLVLGPLMSGLVLTLKITAVSLILAFFFGLLTAIFRLSRSFVARILARGYLEFIRNTPLLVQIFFIYFVLAPVLDIGRFTSAVLALSLFEGAYASEILRAGIVSIHREQWEAAYSSGLSTSQTYRFVVLPQAMRWMLPPLTGQAVSLVKDSALVSTIAVYDLTMQGQAIIAETFLTFEIWLTVAALYFFMTATLSFVANRLEHRFRIPT